MQVKTTTAYADAGELGSGPVNSEVNTPNSETQGTNVGWSDMT